MKFAFHNKVCFQSFHAKQEIEKNESFQAFRRCLIFFTTSVNKEEIIPPIIRTCPRTPLCERISSNFDQLLGYFCFGIKKL